MDHNLENFFRNKFKRSENDADSTWNVPPDHVLEAAFSQMSIRTEKNKYSQRYWVIALLVLLGIIGGQHVYFQHKIKAYQQHIQQIARTINNNSVQINNSTRISAKLPGNSQNIIEPSMDIPRQSPTKFSEKKSPEVSLRSDKISSFDVTPNPTEIEPTSTTMVASVDLLPNIYFKPVYTPKNPQILPHYRQALSEVNLNGETWSFGALGKMGFSRFTMEVPEPAAGMSLTRYDRWAPHVGLAVAAERSLGKHLLFSGSIHFTRHLNHSLLQAQYAYEPAHEMHDANGKLFYFTSPNLVTPMGDSKVSLGFPMDAVADHGPLDNETLISQHLNIISVQGGPGIKLGQGRIQWQTGIGVSLNHLLSTETIMDITLKMNNHVMLEASEQPYLKPQTRSTFVSAYAETGLAIDLSSDFQWQTSLQFSQSLQSLRTTSVSSSATTHLQDLAFKTGIILKIK